MNGTWFYRCATCGATYEIVPGRYLCAACAAAQMGDRPLAGVLDVDWEGDGQAGLTEGGVPLPVAAEWFPPIPVGATPLWAPARLRQTYDAPRLWIKDDTCNPSGSYKDRASYLVAAFARRHGMAEVVLASTGNAASSMAAVGAAAGLRVKVFLPAAAPVAKRIQVLQYGAELVSVDGNYDLAYDLSLDHARRTGALSRNTAYNPLTIEGKKTAAFEIVADLARAGAGEPDQVFVPVGDGVILAGVYRGFENLLRMGRLRRMPTVWACQAEGSSAIARALLEPHTPADPFGPPRPAVTLADSIAVDVPRNGLHALGKLHRHRGRAVVVTDAEILAAQRKLAAGCGLFGEPSSCAAFAGWMKVRNTLSPAANSVVMITGSGLKDIAAAARGLELDS